MAKQITRQEAIEIVRSCEKGLLMVGEPEPIPVIGELPEDERHKVKIIVNSYEFGNENLDLSRVRD